LWSARLAPAEKGVTHELVDVPFGAHREQTHLARQPFAKLPAFEYDGFTLYETQAIVRYMDELTMRLDEASATRSAAVRAEFGPVGSEKRRRLDETRAGQSNSVPASGDAMAEAFRRAGLAGKTPGHQ
jgi:glutathione S-transferase